MDTKTHTLPHVVVLGAGFGGLRAARALANAPVQVTLIDRNNYHLFQPLLYQVATSALSVDAIAYPVRTIFRKQENLRFHLGVVKSIDLDHKTLENEAGTLPYDYLVIALGGATNYFGLDSVEKASFGLKDLEDATAIRNHMLGLFEQVAKEPDLEKRKAMLTFVIVGGGPTGVECAGALSELIDTVLRHDYPEINFDDVQILLLEAADRLLSAMPEDLGKFAEKVLKGKHVTVCYHTAVTNYDGSEVKLKDGSSIATRTLIWAAGVRSSKLLDTLGLTQDRLGRVKVEPTLQALGHPEVFFVGDTANLADEHGNPLPMLAPVAIQEGETAAKNIIRMVKGEPLQPFQYHDPGVLATIGRSQAVAQLGHWKFKGLLAWLVWVVVHIYQLIGFRNRAVVMLDWAWTYLFHERAVRLIGPG